MNPKQIKIKNKINLIIIWEEKSESVIPLKYLRDECPCATCKGESVLLKTFRPPELTVVTPDMYKVKNIEVVGDYAIQITWGDGHSTGIYSWDYLKELDKGKDNSQRQDYDKLL